MTKNKEFSILKWVVFPMMALVLGGIVGWFNYQVFKVVDGAGYIVAVALIVFFSIAINKYTNSPFRSLAIAAFTCEVFLTVILIINAAYSLSVQREMSIAGQGEVSRREELKEIKGLDRASRREAIKQLGPRQDRVSVFKREEAPLFWIMIAELSLFAICAFVLYGISQVMERREEQAVRREKDEMWERVERRNLTPEVVRARERVFDGTASSEDRQKAKITNLGDKRRASFDAGSVATGAHKNPTENSSVATEIGKLREQLSVISSYYPKRRFAADPEGDWIWIRLLASVKGREKTVASTKVRANILKDVNDPDFRGKLIDHLMKKGFPLDAEKGRER
jgi:hypothetical protein